MEKPKKLAIRGKVINIEKINEKSQAQFAAQLKQNGIVLEAEELEKLYTMLTAEPESVEAKQAEREAKRAEKREQMKLNHKK